MIQLSSKVLSSATVAHLQATQQKIDGEPDFKSKALKADSLWNNKKQGKGKKAFTEIKDTLTGMCSGVKNCTYCEHNEADDIEHIYPKKLFPDRTFVWENYILTCRQCNTDYKADKFAVFDPHGSSVLLEIPQQRGTYLQPVTNDGAMIDPRAENPFNFMRLDIRERTFLFVAEANLSVRDEQKATYTIKLLGLNRRDALVEARKKAAHYYLDRLERYIKAKRAATFADLEEVTQEPDRVDETQPFEAERTRIVAAIKSDITHHQHPTVWQELKRQRDQLPRTNHLLDQAPEALEW
jgi:uncharacterized protein (TIGR02646 family)